MFLVIVSYTFRRDEKRQKTQLGILLHPCPRRYTVVY